MIESMHPIEYDDYGRMRYNPDIHFAQFEPWTDDDLDYLINWYEIIGLEEMSFALGKTESTIKHKVYKLRRTGKMSIPKTISKSKRILRREIDNKKATKEPTKVSKVAIRKNSTPLYHRNGGMQIAN
jgi:hypothetical protein